MNKLIINRGSEISARSGKLSIISVIRLLFDPWQPIDGESINFFQVAYHFIAIGRFEILWTCYNVHTHFMSSVTYVKIILSLKHFLFP